jgi:hypothetical protein
MDKKETTRDEDDQLRETLLRGTPRPSAAHDQLILDAARKKAAGTRRTKARPQNWIMVGAGLAASVVLAMVIWQSPMTDSPPIDAGVRGAGELAVWPAENTLLAAEPDEFRWAAQAGAERYRIRLHNDSAELVWTSDWVLDNRQPAPVVADLMFARGARYFWVVEVDGSASRQSLGPYWFRIE